MTSPAGRIRAELQASTGVDFAEYADDEFVDAITGWSGLVGLIKEAAIAVSAGLAVVVGAALVAAFGPIDGDAATGLVIGGVVAGIGTTVLVLALRVRRRIPIEITRVFEVAARMADRVAEDIAGGRLTISATDAARGVAIVAAVPALTRATQRRFPLLGTAVAPVAGSILSRSLIRVWPGGRGSIPIDRLEGPARHLDTALASAREGVVSKLGTAVRWATLPLVVAGSSVMVLGIAIFLVSLTVS